MFAKPRFRASLDIHTVASTLFLLDEHRQHIFAGDSYCTLAPLLDGHHTLADMHRLRGDKLPLPQLLGILHEWNHRGLLAEGEELPPNRERAFWEYTRSGGKATQADTPSVALHALGAISIEPLREALQANGIAISSAAESQEAALRVVVTEDYLKPELEAMNLEALVAQQPWMLVKPSGMILWLGPIFQPYQTGCWRCLEQRLRSNQQVIDYVERHRVQSAFVTSPPATLPVTLDLGHNLAATAIAEWFAAPQTSSLRGQMRTFDLATRELRNHYLVRRPQCPACGDLTVNFNDASRPLQLTSQKKTFREDGGHRTLSPSETFERYKHHVSPLLGAVSELSPALGHWSELTPVFNAGHNFSIGVESLAFLRQSIRGLSGGKGATPIQAKVSGLCEALERYSAHYFGDECAIRGTYADLQPKAIHPNDCLGFSPEQFRGRKEWNATQAMAARSLLIPNPFDVHLDVDWTPIWSLTAEQYRYLPTALCYYGHPDFVRGQWCNPDSNGLAAGNTLEEAILQGFMELVERDAVALWWYNRIKRRRVDLHSFPLPYLGAIKTYYASLNRELWVLDITSDLNLPTFACISWCTDRPSQDIVLGFGTHFDAKIAILRAVTEVNQFLPSVRLTNPDGSTRYLFGDALAIQWWTTATLEANDYLLPDASLAPATFAEFPDQSSDDLLTDIERCVEVCRQHDMEMLALDQTRPDIGLNVAKVVVPQLCHFWRRLGKPRLYETPVAMGWIEKPLEADELNPYSIFF